jgi:hypothetical protein
MKPAFKPRRDAPRLTKAPWAGFTPHDHPRDAPLPACPASRCRRAKRCLEAHDGLYCRRTHFSHAEYMGLKPKTPAVQLEDLLEPNPMVATAKRIAARMEDSRQKFEAMQRRWKAGEFDALYGKYKAGGVIVQPPPRDYVEERHW